MCIEFYWGVIHCMTLSSHQKSLQEKFLSGFSARSGSGSPKMLVCSQLADSVTYVMSHVSLHWLTGSLELDLWPTISQCIAVYHIWHIFSVCRLSMAYKERLLI